MIANLDPELLHVLSDSELESLQGYPSCPFSNENDPQKTKQISLILDILNQYSTPHYPYYPDIGSILLDFKITLGENYTINPAFYETFTEPIAEPLFWTLKTIPTHELVPFDFHLKTLPKSPHWRRLFQSIDIIAWWKDFENHNTVDPFTTIKCLGIQTILLSKIKPLYPHLFSIKQPSLRSDTLSVATEGNTLTITHQNGTIKNAVMKGTHWEFESKRFPINSLVSLMEAIARSITQNSEPYRHLPMPWGLEHTFATLPNLRHLAGVTSYKTKQMKANAVSKAAFHIARKIETQYHDPRLLKIIKLSYSISPWNTTPDASAKLDSPKKQYLLKDLEAFHACRVVFVNHAKNNTVCPKNWKHAYSKNLNRAWNITLSKIKGYLRCRALSSWIPKIQTLFPSGLPHAFTTSTHIRIYSAYIDGRRIAQHLNPFSETTLSTELGRRLTLSWKEIRKGIEFSLLQDPNPGFSFRKSEDIESILSHILGTPILYHGGSFENYARRPRTRSESPFYRSPWPQLADDNHFTVEWIGTPEKLYQEGVQIKHCVATHTRTAQEGRGFFYHLTEKNGEQRPLTARLQNDGMVIEIRSHSNRMPPDLIENGIAFFNQQLANYKLRKGKKTSK